MLATQPTGDRSNRIIRDFNGGGFQGSHGDGGIHLLMFAANANIRFRPRFVNELQRRLTFLSAPPDDYVRFLALRRRDNRNACGLMIPAFSRAISAMECPSHFS